MLIYFNKIDLFFFVYIFLLILLLNVASVLLFTFTFDYKQNIISNNCEYLYTIRHYPCSYGNFTNFIIFQVWLITSSSKIIIRSKCILCIWTCYIDNKQSRKIINNYMLLLLWWITEVSNLKLYWTNHECHKGIEILDFC